jgi:ribosome biogenesis protein ERB1
LCFAINDDGVTGPRLKRSNLQPLSNNRFFILRKLMATKNKSYHARAIRSVGFHPNFPLLASSSDDGSIQLFHARVYNDLMSDPLIVPLKILRGHAIEGGLGVLDMVWLHSRPWLVSAGADKDVAVWCP